MRKVISVIELDYHAEVLDNLLELIKGCGIIINVFTTNKIFEQLSREHQNREEIHYYLKDEYQKPTVFLKDHLNLINSSALLIINTLKSATHFLAISHIIAPVVLRIHNVNFYFARRRSMALENLCKVPFSGYKHFYNRIFTKKEIFSIPKALKKTSIITLPNEKIKEYAASLSPKWLKGKKLEVLPFSYHDSNISLSQHDEQAIKITIPGKVDFKRRDYYTFLYALDKIKNEIIYSVNLHILGKPANNNALEIIKKFKALENKHLKIITYNHYIPQDHFQEIIKESDFFVLPLKIKTNYLFWTEYYGLSKISGSISDIIRYAKPAIITEGYELGKDLDQFCENYRDKDDLAKKLLSWINEKKYSFYHQAAKEVLLKYNKASLLNKIYHWSK